MSQYSVRNSNASELRSRAVHLVAADPALRTWLLEGLHGIVADAYPLRPEPLLPDDAGLLVVAYNAAEISPTWIRALRQRGLLYHIVVCHMSDGNLDRPPAALSWAGADRVIALDGQQMLTELREDLECRRAHLLPLTMRQVFDEQVWNRGHAIQTWCARNAYCPLSERHIARHFGVARRTVLRAVQRLGWPDAEMLERSARLLHVGAAMTTTTRSIEELANYLNFASAAALQHFVKRLTGMTAGELARTGPLMTALRTWNARRQLIA